MQQISNTVFCDDTVLNLPLETRLMPSPYEETPYLLIEAFFTPLECALIMHEASTHLAPTQQTAEIKVSEHGAYVAKPDRSIRKTLTVALSDQILKIYEEAFSRHQNRIERFFNAPLSTASHPQGLYYETGGFYEAHADDSSMIVDANGHTVGYKLVAPQRKITTIAFCNSHIAYDAQGFKGGEVRFNFFYDAKGEPVTIRPKAGMLLVFPSNPIYTHEVTEVLTAERFCIVQWHNAVL